jgi:hypothetical protein
LVFGMWTLSLLAGVLVTPLFGPSFVLAGWLEAYGRLEDEGLVALRLVFQPTLAKPHLERGVTSAWLAGWRSSLWLFVAELPGVALSLLPAGGVYLLASPVAAPLPETAEQTLLWLSLLLPGAVGLWISAVSVCHAHRRLSQSPASTPGEHFALAAAGWRAAVSELRGWLGVAAGATALLLLTATAVALQSGIGWLLRLGPGAFVVGWWTLLLGLAGLMTSLAGALAEPLDDDGLAAARARGPGPSLWLLSATRTTVWMLASAWFLAAANGALVRWLDYQELSEFVDQRHAGFLKGAERKYARAESEVEAERTDAQRRVEDAETRVATLREAGDDGDALARARRDVTDAEEDLRAVARAGDARLAQTREASATSARELREKGLAAWSGWNVTGIGSASLIGCALLLVGLALRRRHRAADAVAG